MEISSASLSDRAGLSFFLTPAWRRDTPFLLPFLQPFSGMKLGILLLIATALLGSGCGRSDTVYADADGFIVIERLGLPSGFYDQSVNHADAGSDGQSLTLRLRGDSSRPGSFNDASLIGNRAIVGLGGYDSSKLADFSLQMTSSSTTTANVRVSLLVDLNCDGTSVRTFESSVPVGTSKLDTTAAWTVAGADLTDSSGQVLVSSNTASSLTAFLATLPNACLKNAVSDAPDAPKSLPMASVLLSIGSGLSTSIESVSISSLTLNTDLYQSWSVP